MSQYIDRKTVYDSYRPKSGLMSPGLKRAREPYRIRNALTGLTLGAFAVGIWAYSIGAVKQDVFDDVDAEVLAQQQQQHVQQQRVEMSGVKEGVVNVPLIPATMSSGSASLVPSNDPAPSRRVAQARGVLQRLDRRYPWLLDPQRKTLVWGAPPLDDIGKLWTRS